MATDGRRDGLRRGERVRVEFRDGHNCVGSVERIGTDGHGRRRIIVEDTQGGRRSVSAWRPCVEVVRLDGKQSLQEELRAANRRGGGAE